MKNIKFLGFIFLLACLSCKKTENDMLPAATATEISVRSAQLSDWTQASNWTNTDNIYHTSVSAGSINAGIVSNGLVLLFVKTGSTPVLLPQQLGNTYWYYQAEEGSIQISAIAANGPEFIKDQSFSYIFFSNEDLDKLESKGFTKSELVDLTYNQLIQLIK